MSYQTALLDALKLAGLDPQETLGWQTRGSGIFAPQGSVDHHTAGPRLGVQPSLGTVINGRGLPNPLPGPLCNTFGPREESLRVVLVAAGKANHAGEGTYAGLAGNVTVFGHEEEHSGQPDEPFSELRKDRMARVHAAFAYLGKFDPRSHTCQHYEWAPTRKIDFIRAQLDPNEFRRRVWDRLVIMKNGPTPTPPPAPAPQEDIMRSANCPNADGREQRFWIDGAGHLQTLWQKADGSWSGTLQLGGDYVWAELTEIRLSTGIGGAAGRIEVYGLSGAFASPCVIAQTTPNGTWPKDVTNQG